MFRLIRLCACRNNANIAPAYVAEKRGNLQQMIEIFVSQQRYTADYIRQIEVFSADDGYEFHGWAQVNA